MKILTSKGYADLEKDLRAKVERKNGKGEL